MRQWVYLNSCFALALLFGAIGYLWAQRDPDTDRLMDERRKQRWEQELEERKPTVSGLAAERLTTARKLTEESFTEFAMGKTTIADFLTDALRRQQEAELLVAKTKAERIAALEKVWFIAKCAEEIQEAKFKAKTIRPKDYFAVHLARLETEYELIKTKQNGE